MKFFDDPPCTYVVGMDFLHNGMQRQGKGKFMRRNGMENPFE